MIALFTRAAATESGMDALVESHAQLVDAVERRDADEAARISSEMMDVLRIEVGRRHALVTDQASTRQRPRVGMLENTSKEKGDRP